MSVRVWTCEHVPQWRIRTPVKETAKIRVKNREPVPAYAMADADRDSDLGDDSPVVSRRPKLCFAQVIDCLTTSLVCAGRHNSSCDLIRRSFNCRYVKISLLLLCWEENSWLSNFYFITIMDCSTPLNIFMFMLWCLWLMSTMLLTFDCYISYLLIKFDEQLQNLMITICR